VLKRRFPCIPITILPVAVQGEGAAQQIVDAIKLANKLNKFDVLLLTRGGGSLEDLWPFNEEIVARAIFASQIPIVSAVGHEVDVTISDFVADARAPTPSAAAELLSPNADDWLQTFVGYEVLLRQALGKIVKHGRLVVDSFRARLRHPGQRLQAQSQHLDHLEMRLNRAIKVQLQQARSRLQEAILLQRHFHPSQGLQQHQQRLQHVSRRLQQEIQQQLKSKKQQFVKTVALLNSISPIHTLARGYSLTLDQDGHIVRNTSQVAVGQSLTTKLGTGELLCRVESVNPNYATLLAGFGKNKKD
jgi:exodeoxyribonuclease VII large subunit